MLKKYLEIGKIVATHALKGELKIDSWCDTPQVICSLKNVYLEQGNKKLKVISAKSHKNQAILLLEGIDSVEKGDELRGKIIYADRSDLKIEKGSYFIQDIIGLSVLDYDSKKLYGTVSNVFSTGANDVYEITDEQNNKYLMPAIKQVIIETNIDKGQLLIKPMKGIFSDED